MTTSSRADGLPTLGAGLFITNPLSSGYLAYLGAAKALLCVVDELVIVDGGSTDESLHTLHGWIGDDPRVTVISNNMTHWGTGDCWHVGQVMVNANMALRSLTTDWAYVYSADGTLDVATAGELKAALAELPDELWVRASRRRAPSGEPVRYDDKALFFNLAAMRRQGTPLVYGVDASTGLTSDLPIEPREVARFADPETGVMKPLFRGPSPGATVCLRCNTVVYGHFYYTPVQVDQKITRWEGASARAIGRASARLTELRLNHHLYGLRPHLSAQEVRLLPHPVHALEVLEKLYHDGMVGGMHQSGGRISEAYRRCLLLALRMERKLRTITKRHRGYRGEFESLVWNPMTNEDLAEMCVQDRSTLSEFVHS